MPRSLDDDSRSRMEAAEQAVRDDERLQAKGLREKVRKAERNLAQYRTRWRARLSALIVGVCSLLAGGGWTVAVWGTPDRFIPVDIVCGTLAVLAALTVRLAPVTPPNVSPPVSQADLQEELEAAQEELRFFNAVAYPSLAERRSLYREDVADLIEQYQSDSRYYRRVHNSLQVLIMTGSIGSTTVAALDWGRQPTWQSITLTSISFAVTLAAAFTGYYKYRERSYFLQETADSIEEHANALALGVGEYADLENDEKSALAQFTKNVERLRNEQRRRQQQLDQPSEQSAPGSGQAPS
ncbi:DUF4231 domain-containing protein [Actinacidiphila glaucinigra]|uniref:DUF4231 domain-containing protein n=1 Tax=Actinacidiphila glaucinigra TaxID=235986 RepID=UPI00372473D1